MNDSEQQVHSRPCNQRTGVRGLFSMAQAILGMKAGPRPSEVAVKEQNLRKLRREMPCLRITS